MMDEYGEFECGVEARPANAANREGHSEWVEVETRTRILCWIQIPATYVGEYSNTLEKMVASTKNRSVLF